VVKMSNAKYKTIDQLIAAFQTGELSKSEWLLIVDNDSSYLTWMGNPALENEKYKEGQKLWGGDQIDVLDVLKILNIPCCGA